MKKAILTIALVATALSAGAFDEDRIVSSFGVVSDVHIDGAANAPSVKFRKALEQLRDKAAEQDSDGLDAVLVAGDLINNAFSNVANYIQMQYFRNVYESVFNPLEVPMIYTPGNHDTFKWWTSATPSEAKHLSALLGEDYFKTDIDPEAREAMECRHCVVGDVHILCIVPVSASPVTYTPESKAWLDAQLSALTLASPGKYVIVLTHPMIHNTVYGSLLGNYWATEDLTPILSKYPQVITFGGHLHFPIADPRSICQGDFTTVGCGSVRYMAIEDGHYEYMRSKTVMKDADDISQGLLMQIDASGDVRLTRMNFSSGGTYGEPWVLAHPAADRSHLKAYNHDSLRAANAAPEMGALRLETDVRTRDGLPVTAVFAKAEDDEFAHDYLVTVTSADTVTLVKKVLADFYRVDDVKDMRGEWRVPLGKLRSGDYTVSVEAFDSWGEGSGKVSASLRVPGADVLLDVPVEQGWLFDSDKTCKLNVNVGGKPGVRTCLTLALVSDVTLADGTRDTLRFVKKYVTVGNVPLKLGFDLGRLAPGFYQVNLGYDGITDYRFNIGVSPERIVSPQSKQPDFDEFWDNTLAELAKVSMDAEFFLDKEHSNADRTTYTVHMKSLGGETIGGTLCVPNKPGKFVTYIDYLGYGAQPYYYDPSANPDCVEFLLSVRDQGIFKRKDHYRWIERGLGSKETFYYRGAFCDVVRAIDLVCSLAIVDQDHLYARGESQGGAFTWVSASLDHRIKAIAPAVPFLSDFEDYCKIVRWPLWELFAKAGREGIAREEMLKILTYFDMKNFTDRIQCPVYMSFGLQDATCPPHTNFAGYNQVRTEKHYWCAPQLGHDQWDEKAWHESRAEWFKEIINRK